MSERIYVSTGDKSDWFFGFLDFVILENRTDVSDIAEEMVRMYANVYHGGKHESLRAPKKFPIDFEPSTPPPTIVLDQAPGEKPIPTTEQFLSASAKIKDIEATKLKHREEIKILQCLIQKLTNKQDSIKRDHGIPSSTTQ